MLYTTYLYKLKTLSRDTIKLLIMRFQPKININNYNNLYSAKSLSPSQDLLLQYKKDNDWKNYTNNFINEMKNRKDMIASLIKIKNYLIANNDLILICYEKDYLHCHRYLIAQYLQQFNINWKEI